MSSKQVNMIGAEQSATRPLARSQRQFPISERRLLLMLGDITAIFVSVLLALRIWALIANQPFTWDFAFPQLFVWWGILMLIWVTLASANDFYNLHVTSQMNSSMIRLGRIMLQLLMVYVAVFFLSPRDALPRLFIVYYGAISFLLIVLWRIWRPFLIGWTGQRRRALIVGTGRSAEYILQAIKREASTYYDVIGCYSSLDESNDVNGSPMIWNSETRLSKLINDFNIAELILSYGNEVPGDVFQGVMECYERGVTIMPMPILYEQITGRVPIEYVGQQHWSVVLPLEGRSVSFKLYQGIKRVMDVVLSVIGLILFAPFFPFLALAIKFTRGPVFYRQERVGRNGLIFKVYKLRSMVQNAEGKSGPQWAQSNDPRVTRIGALLRKTRLDEFPQLINVLRGEMSIIGPRPERPVFVDQLATEIPFYRTRLVAKPGLTGWAQVRYRYGNTTQDALTKLQYDLYYIRHQSLSLDLLIIIRTIGIMLMFRGM